MKLNTVHACLIVVQVAGCAQGASLSLSDVKMKARTSATDFEYRTLTNGIDRTKNSSHQWLIHLPWASNLTVTTWPQQTTPILAQLHATNQLHGGIFDETDGDSGTGRWWIGPREWGQGLHTGDGGCDIGPVGLRASGSKKIIYDDYEEWWQGRTYNGWNKTCGGTTIANAESGLKWREFKDRNHLISKPLYYLYHHYLPAWKPGRTDLINAEVGEDTFGSNIHMAFGRGASRQYDIPWGIDFSDWFGDSNADTLSDYSGWWQRAASGAIPCWEVQTEDAYVGWLTDGNKAYYKASGTSAAVELATGVQEFKLGDTSNRRFVVRTSTQVKAGSGANNLTVIRNSGDVASILDVSGNRVAMLLTGNSVVVRDGSTDRAYSGSYGKGWLSGNHVVLLKGDGTLARETAAGNLTGTLTTIDTSVADATVDGGRILYLKTNGNLYYKSDLTSGGAATRVSSGVAAENTAGVKAFALAHDGSNVRIGVLYNNGALRVGTSVASIGQSSSLRLEQVDRFALATDRIGAIQQGDEGMQVLQVKEGNLTAGWLPMMAVRMVDFGLSAGSSDEALFVHTEADHKILVKNRGLEQLEYTGTNSSDSHNYKNNYRVWKASGHQNGLGASALWGGHSENLMQRIYYAAYMGGANVLYEEGSMVFFFLGRRSALDDEALTLSREGVMAKHYYHFTNNVLPHEKRGIPWAPIALMLDHYHGLGAYSWWDEGIWKKAFTKGEADQMNVDLLHAAWGDAAYGGASYSEDRFMVNGPAGDLFDVLTDDVLTGVSGGADSDLHTNYPVLVLSGEIRPDAAMRTKLQAYVSGGGNLVINSAMNINSFPATFTGVTVGTAANQSIPGLRWKIDDSTETFSSAQTWSVHPMTLTNNASVLMESTDTTPRTLASIRTHGNGRVIVVGLPNIRKSNWNTWGTRWDVEFWEFLLGKLARSPAVNPFSVTGTIEYTKHQGLPGAIGYQVNYRGGDTWLVTLANNEGITKGYDTKNSGGTTYRIYRKRQTFDDTKTQTVTVKLQEAGRAISSVREYPIFHGIWKTPSGAVSHSNNQFVVSVGPGETRIFEIKTRAN